MTDTAATEKTEGEIKMSRGLLKLSNAANAIEARKDFAKLITIAKESGKSHLAVEHMYPENAGWRVIDKHIKRLRAALGETK